MTFFRRSNSQLYIRSSIFGIEDALVSTVGLLSGVAAAGMEKEAIFVTGVVLVFVEALSMGAGNLLSEHSVEEAKDHREVPLKKSLLAGAVMFVSYFFAGFIPLLPYLFLSVSVAFWVSIALSLVSLFLLGAVFAHFFQISILRKGGEMIFIGGAAIFAGVVIGSLIG